MLIKDRSQHVFGYTTSASKPKEQSWVHHYEGVKMWFVSTNRIDPSFVCRSQTLFWCPSTILEQTSDFRYEKGMFQALTYLF